MKKTISFLLIISLVMGVMGIMPILAEENDAEQKIDAIELNLTNLEMDMRSDQSGKFTNDETGAYKNGGINGSFIEGKINIEVPGVYHFYGNMLLRSGNGVVQISLDGKDFGERLDTNSANNVEKELDFGSIYIEEPGEKRIRFTSKSTVGGGYNLGVKSLRVVKESLKINTSTKEVGNVFIEGNEIVFDAEFQNMTSKAIDIIIKPKAVSSYGTEVNLDEEQMTIAANTKYNKEYRFNIAEKNTWDFIVEVDIPDEQEHIIHSKPFSYIEKAIQFGEDKRILFGTCIHISGLKKGEERMNSMMTMLKNSGIHIIRDEYYWDHVELKKNEYTFYADDYIEELNKIGIKPHIVLSYGNSLWCSQPYDDVTREAFANYAKALAEHLDGKVYSYEVWNEWNGGWGGSHGPEVYGPMMKEVYNAVKSVSDAEVVGGATITAAWEWFENMFKTGVYEYCDGISYHPYCMPGNPDAKRFQRNIEDNYLNMYNMMKQFGEPKGQWITEFGWYTSDNPLGSFISEQEQADYITRAQINALAYGLDKIFFYDFKNDGINPEESEHNYGIIKSWEDAEDVKYAAKLAYVSNVATINKLTQAELIEEYRPVQDARVYVFDDNGTERVAMYYVQENGTNVKSCKISLKGEAAKMSAEDMYGNPITDEITEINSSVIWLEGEPGQFDIDDVIIRDRNEVMATYGRLKMSDGLYTDDIHDFYNIGTINCFGIGSGERYSEISCDVDDGYISGGVTPVTFEVMYFDEGNGGIYVEYSSSDGAKKTETVNLTNSGKWKKAVFTVQDAAFANDLDGKDFKIALDNADRTVYISGARVYKTRDYKHRKAYIEFDDDEQLEALNEQKIFTYWVFSDTLAVNFEIASHGMTYEEKDGRKCVVLSANNEALYAQVDVHDEIIYGSFDPVKVSVDYFDEGKGTFTIAYDIGFANSFKSSDIIQLNDTKEWKTAEFIIEDGWWKNFVNNETDFRIALWAPEMGRSPEGIAFGSIMVEAIDGFEENEIKEVSFSDIDGHWAEDVIMQMSQKEVIEGYEDNTVKPDDSVKVSEFITMVVKRMKYTASETGGKWYDKYVNTLLELGIVNEGEFDDYERNITRGEMARIAARVAGGIGADIDTADISDFDSIPQEYREYVAGVYKKGIMQGDDTGAFRAKSDATRAEAAVILSNI